MNKNRAILLIASPFILIATVMANTIEAVKELKEKWKYFK